MYVYKYMHDTYVLYNQVHGDTRHAAPHLWALLQASVTGVCICVCDRHVLLFACKLVLCLAVSLLTICLYGTLHAVHNARGRLHVACCAVYCVALYCTVTCCTVPDCTVL